MPLDRILGPHWFRSPNRHPLRPTQARRGYGGNYSRAPRHTAGCKLGAKFLTDRAGLTLPCARGRPEDLLHARPSFEHRRAVSSGWFALRAPDAAAAAIRCPAHPTCIGISAHLMRVTRKKKQARTWLGNGRTRTGGKPILEPDPSKSRGLI